MLLWSLTREDGQYGYPKRSLKGHSHFVQDVVISSDGQFALTGSWDHTLRLWDLHTGQTTRRFIGHTKDVLSVAFSMDNRQACASSFKSCHMLAAPVNAYKCFGIERRMWVIGSGQWLLFYHVVITCTLQSLRPQVMHADCVWRPGQDN